MPASLSHFNTGVCKALVSCLSVALPPQHQRPHAVVIIIAPPTLHTFAAAAVNFCFDCINCLGLVFRQQVKKLEHLHAPLCQWSGLVQELLLLDHNQGQRASCCFYWEGLSPPSRREAAAETALQDICKR
jgi:hypothetical protein